MPSLKVTAVGTQGSGPEVGVRVTGDKTSLGGRQPQPDVDGLVERTAALERLLEEALFSFPLSERVRSAHNIAVFDCAVKQLLDQIVSREIVPPKELLNDVNRAMESIQPALTRLLSATNPIERNRSLQAVDSAAVGLQQIGMFRHQRLWPSS
jgi:hypothetical protein